MKYLLDTSLLIELAHAAEEDWVCRWMDAFDEDDIYISMLTVGEIVREIEREPNLERKSALSSWVEDGLLVRFHGKVIPLDLEVITAWGRLSAQWSEAGIDLSTIDSLIAATIHAKKMVLITYDREVYSGSGIEVSDPWQG